MPDFQPVHFVPARYEQQILAKPVRHVIAAPHEKEERINTNHWCLYLSTSPTSSVRIDCQPSYTFASSVLQGGSKANVVISELLDEEVSCDVQARFVLDLAPGLTVGHFYTQIIQAGHHKYEFDSNGVGCRWWVSGQIDLFSQLRFFTLSSQVTAVKAGILKVWPDQTPLALDEGAYYQ